MMTKTEKTFTILFLFIVIADLVCGSVDGMSVWRYITKPTIVLSLMFFFWKESKTLTASIKILTILALMFSLIGDMLLLFVERSPDYFMFGLIAFLVTHVMYIFVFLKHRNRTKSPWIFLVILMLYAIGLFYFLMDGLDDMLIPVLLYIIVILAMATTAFLREEKVPKRSYQYVLLGAILFLISDSILAIHTFYETIPFSNLFIMLTYALAQYFIVIGIKKAL